MPEVTADQAAKLDALAGRVCALRQELASQPAETRRGRIEREIEEAVASFPPRDQFSALTGLLSRLPDAVIGSVPAPQTAPAAPTVDQLVRELVGAWSKATPEQRAAVASSLRQGGVVPAAPSSGSGVAMPENVARDLRTKLQLSENEVPDPQRTQEIAVLLCEFAANIDRVVWGMWSKKLAPQSTLRSTGPIVRYMKEHVVGTATPGGPTVSGEVRRLLEMTIAVVSNIGQAGAAFGDKFVSQYSPASIEDSVGDAAFRNKDAECWKVYKARAGTLDRSGIDAEITQTISKLVEEWMKRTVRQ